MNETANEMMVVEQSTAPSLNNQFDLVDVEGAKAFMENYQELVKALLDDGDYQPIQTQQGIKKSKKKSAWRKLATAFNISDEVIEKEIIRDEDYCIISARFEVRATLPNGRHGVGTGSCSIFDKINKKDKTKPSSFELRQRFTNAEHDVISTAHTRAKSRAISDLIGAGEVSAEELSGMEKPVKPKKPVKPTKAKTKSKKKDDEAIEVEAKEVKKLTLKEIADNNKAVRLAVDEIQGQGQTADRPRIQDKLLDLMDQGKITSDEYKEAKALLE